MKSFLHSQLFYKIIPIASMAMFGSFGLPVNAQNLPPEVINSIFYPNSSQRFFREGYEQLEIEIQRLQNRSEVSSSLLEVDLNLLQQQQQWRERQELRLPKMLQDSDHSFLDHGHGVLLPRWQHN